MVFVLFCKSSLKKIDYPGSGSMSRKFGIEKKEKFDKIVVDCSWWNMEWRVI